MRQVASWLAHRAAERQVIEETRARGEAVERADPSLVMGHATRFTQTLDDYCDRGCADPGAGPGALPFRLISHPQRAEHELPYLPANRVEIVNFIRKMVDDLGSRSKCRYSHRTCYLAQHYFDRCVRSMGIENFRRTVLDNSKGWDSIWILAVSCAVLAVKMEEQQPPTLPELTDYFRGRFSEQQLRVSEVTAMKLLNRQLYVLTVWDCLGWAVEVVTSFECSLRLAEYCAMAGPHDDGYEYSGPIGHVPPTCSASQRTPPGAHTPPVPVESRRLQQLHRVMYPADAGSAPRGASPVRRGYGELLFVASFDPVPQPPPCVSTTWWKIVEDIPWDIPHVLSQDNLNVYAPFIHDITLCNPEFLAYPPAAVALASLAAGAVLCAGAQQPTLMRIAQLSTIAQSLQPWDVTPAHQRAPAPPEAQVAEAELVLGPAQVNRINALHSAVGLREQIDALAASGRAEEAETAGQALHTLCVHAYAMSDTHSAGILPFMSPCIHRMLALASRHLRVERLCSIVQADPTRRRWIEDAAERLNSDERWRRVCAKLPPDLKELRVEEVQQNAVALEALLAAEAETLADPFQLTGLAMQLTYLDLMEKCMAREAAAQQASQAALQEQAAQIATDMPPPDPHGQQVDADSMATARADADSLATAVDRPAPQP